MLDSFLAELSLLERIKYDTYCTAYNNIRRRLCVSEEKLEIDFFTVKHIDEEALLKKYHDTPTAVTCWNRGMTTGNYLSSVTYLIVGGLNRLVLLLPPEIALIRNLPRMAILENGFFKPYLGCASTYWHKWIEPEERGCVGVVSDVMADTIV